MGFLGFLLLGLIAGTIAKAILKDKASGGWVNSLIIGVIGAFVGGWIGSLIFNVGLGNFFDLRTWALGILGSVVVLWIYAAITGRQKA